MAKATKKHTYESVQTVISESGELIEQTSTRESYVANEPGYVKLYLQDVLQLSGLPKSHHDILMCVLKEMNWENKVYLAGKLKKDIIARLGIKLTTFDKALASFVREEILYQVDRGVYLVNPYLFGKGAWKDIKAIRLTVDYESGKRTVATAIDKDQKRPYPAI